MTFAIASLVLQEDALTFGEILADVPHDPAAIFVYLLLAGSTVAIVMGSRRRAPRGPAGKDQGGA